ncbi:MULTISPECIES: HEAT repeat domain-containing protein [unclassified Leptolyngbya]|uniref:HEAT repeat domain-containing protein n=1 Tax=unclassified Leptolyngbya TaxID=2650499 RepID=UPI001685332F|nr:MULTISPECIES: HEAT repeat domain-containing protein [unclassified Leptolyngbya]MBD1909083.1 HEAT repeat domain-containing protein [Leptolyngbya sp. FACHB-8]MBD2157006.1 HEAT repeat domain-containing protein [Leptolyngbya sp. FACHB-16]
MEDLLTTVGLTIFAIGLVLLMRSRGQRRLAQTSSRQSQSNGPATTSTTSATSPNVEQPESPPAKTAPLIVPTLELPTIDTPLATSLNVRDMVEPHHNSTEIPSVQYAEPGAGNTAGIPLDDAMPHQNHGDRQTVLDEINHMGQEGQGDAITRLSHHLEDPDYMVRTAVASALGELATHLQGPRRDEVLAHLQHLSQDASAEVRGQAAAALGRLGT